MFHDTRWKQYYFKQTSFQNEAMNVKVQVAENEAMPTNGVGLQSMAGNYEELELIYSVTTKASLLFIM